LSLVSADEQGTKIEISADKDARWRRLDDRPNSHSWISRRVGEGHKAAACTTSVELLGFLESRFAENCLEALVELGVGELLGVYVAGGFAIEPVDLVEHTLDVRHIDDGGNLETE